jgi:hypothetical protein
VVSEEGPDLPVNSAFDSRLGAFHDCGRREVTQPQEEQTEVLRLFGFERGVAEVRVPGAVQGLCESDGV